MWKSRWPSWVPVPNKPTVSVDVKQHCNQLLLLFTLTGSLKTYTLPSLALHSNRPLMRYTLPSLALHYNRLSQKVHSHYNFPLGTVCSLVEGPGYSACQTGWDRVGQLSLPHCHGLQHVERGALRFGRNRRRHDTEQQARAGVLWYTPASFNHLFSVVYTYASRHVTSATGCSNYFDRMG